MARALSLTLGTDVCTVTAFPDPRVGGACVLRALRRFFGFDAGEEEDPGIAMTLASGPQSGAFRVGEKLSIKGEIVGVDADISASNIVVGGKVRGNLNATGRVEILPQGILTGNLKTGSFAAADGALVKGEIVVDRGSRGRIEVGGQP
jgi:hypothetical protein